MCLGRRQKEKSCVHVLSEPAISGREWGAPPAEAGMSHANTTGCGPQGDENKNGAAGDCLVVSRKRGIEPKLKATLKPHRFLKPYAGIS